MKRKAIDSSDHSNGLSETLQTLQYMLLTKVERRLGKIVIHVGSNDTLFRELENESPNQMQEMAAPH